MTAIVGLLLLAAFATALWLWRSQIPWEIRRHEPWAQVLLHLGDLGSLLLCLRWVRDGFRGLRGDDVGRRRHRNPIGLYLAVWAAWAVNCAATAYVLRHDQAAYVRAHRALAVADRGYIKRQENGTEACKSVYCSYHDDGGHLYHARLSVDALVLRLPDGTFTRLISLSKDPIIFPCRIPIRFDPSWPNRSWIDYQLVIDRAPESTDVILVLSLVPMVLAFLVLIPLAFWALPYELNLVVPFAVQVAFWISEAFVLRPEVLG